MVRYTMTQIGNKINFLPENMNIPVRRREMTHSNTAWLLRNLLVNNSEHSEIKQVMAKLRNLRQKQVFDFNDPTPEKGKI